MVYGCHCVPWQQWSVPKVILLLRDAWMCECAHLCRSLYAQLMLELKDSWNTLWETPAMIKIRSSELNTGTLPCLLSTSCFCSLLFNNNVQIKFFFFGMIWPKLVPTTVFNCFFLSLDLLCPFACYLLSHGFGLPLQFRSFSFKGLHERQSSCPELKTSAFPAFCDCRVQTLPPHGTNTDGLFPQIVKEICTFLP